MKHYSLYAIPLAASLMIPAGFAQQTSSSPSNSDQAQATATQTSDANGNADTKNGQYATGAPLEGQAHEGFWGHLMPFARKKYVKRQMDPIRGRVNELDELTSKNASAIKDVDARATEGIRQATQRASEADQHAQAANTLAGQANQTAQDATTRVQTVQQAVTNIDQYQPVTAAEIQFRPGHTKLGPQSKEALDQIAGQLQGHSGYIVQVQGFSSTRGQAGIAGSQAMANSVVRYLVEEHQVPLFRIYTVGLGNAVMKSANAEANAEAAPAKAKRMRGGKVEVTLLKNGVADLSARNGAANTNQSAIGSTSTTTTGSGQTSNLPQNDQSAKPRD